MTEEEVRRYFETMHRLDAMIDRKIEEREELARLHERACGIASRLEAMDAEINALVDDYADYREEAMGFALKLDKDQCEVVCATMVNWRTLAYTADKMGVSRQWVTKLKKRAVLNLREVVGSSELFMKYRAVLW